MTYIAKMHLWYYAGLAVVLISSLVLIAKTPDKNLQMAIGLFMAIFYVGWALLHHFVHHNIHLKIMLEYVLFATLGVSILYFTLYIVR